MAGDMKVKLRCPACGVSVRARPEVAEKDGRCPKCKEVVRFQRLEDPPAHSDGTDDSLSVQPAAAVSDELAASRPRVS